MNHENYYKILIKVCSEYAKMHRKSSITCIALCVVYKNAMDKILDELLELVNQDQASIIDIQNFLIYINVKLGSYLNYSIHNSVHCLAVRASFNIIDSDIPKSIAKHAKACRTATEGDWLYGAYTAIKEFYRRVKLIENEKD